MVNQLNIFGRTEGAREGGSTTLHGGG